MLYNTIDNVYHINMNKAHVHEHTYIHRSVIYLLKSVAFFFFAFEHKRRFSVFISFYL